MESTKIIPAEGLSRRSGFSFHCGRCSGCCSGKRIQVNPYEILRLAENLNIGTTEFIRLFTENGVHLGRKKDGRCIFLESDGCRVHEDRPLVCRLYPLGRNLGVDGEGSFSYFDLPLFIDAAEDYRTWRRKQ